MRNTARVMKDVKADVLGIIEAENRPALAAFNDEIVAAIGGTPFRHVMLIDNNDERGINVGVMTRANFPIGTMRSHVDDRMSNGQRVFSRDCPEFTIGTPSGAELIILVGALLHPANRRMIGVQEPANGESWMKGPAVTFANCK
jgi:hypothetical protein